MDDVIALLDSYDRLVAAADGTASREELQTAAELGRRVRARRGYLGETVVVALAGGTGAGKSSLVNAMAGEEVAVSGSRRPTTSQPMAWIPANPEPGLVRLLDDIGIEERVGHSSHPDLAIIDLPDIDSLEFDHRLIVERLLPEVDAVVWVVDPEKYQDRILHRDHLSQLADYQDQFLFVINQIDRLGPGDLEKMTADFRSSLTRDGIDQPKILATAADPDIGPMLGIEELTTALRSLGDAKDIVHRKLVIDLRNGASRLAAAARVDTGSGTGFVDRWQGTVTEAANRIAADVVDDTVEAAALQRARVMGRSAAGILPGTMPPATIPLGEPGGGVFAAIRSLDSLITELAEETGGQVATALRGIGVTLDAQLAQVAETLRYGTSLVIPPPPQWVRSLAWLRRLVTIGIVLAVIWVYQSIVGGAELIGPVAAVLIGVAVLGSSLVVAGSVGGKSALEAVARARESLADQAGREIDRRLGRPLRETLRTRAGAAVAFTDFSLAVHGLDRVTSEARPPG